MLGSDILDIVIGMVFVFLLLSLVCSALNEFLEGLVKNRARDLERGIRELVGDPNNATGFVEKIYNHGVVNSLFKGCYSPDTTRNLPSYIPSANFAQAAIDLIKNPPPSGIKLPDNVRKAYTVFEQQAAGDAAKLQASMEDWFNSSMDRVSGWYRRRTQWILIALALLIAIGVNADALRIARTLSNDASLRKGLVAMAEARARQPQGSEPAPAAAPTANTVALTNDPAPTPAGSPAAGQLSAGLASAKTGLGQDGAPDEYVAELDRIGLPIGWPGVAANSTQGGLMSALRAAPGEFREHCIGWLLTAIAISMGAPFWFDLLGKVVTLRSTVKPDTNNS